MKTEPTVKQMHWLKRWENRYIRALQNRYALMWRPLTGLTPDEVADHTAGLSDGDATGSKSKFSICFHRRDRIAAENLTTIFGGLITDRRIERACDLVFDQGSSRSCLRKLDGRLRCPDKVKQLLKVGGTVLKVASTTLTRTSLWIIGFFEADGGFTTDLVYDEKTGRLRSVGIGLTFTQKQKPLLTLLDAAKPGGYLHLISTTDKLTGRAKRCWQLTYKRAPDVVWWLDHLSRSPLQNRKFEELAVVLRLHELNCRRYGSFTVNEALQAERLLFLLRNLTIADDRRRNFHVLGPSRTRIQLNLGQMYRIDAMTAVGNNNSAIAKTLGISRYQVGRYLKSASAFRAAEIIAVKSQDRQIYHYVRKRLAAGASHAQIRSELGDGLSIWQRVSGGDWTVFDRSFTARGIRPEAWGL